MQGGMRFNLGLLTFLPGVWSTAPYFDAFVRFEGATSSLTETLPQNVARSLSKVKDTAPSIIPHVLLPYENHTALPDVRDDQAYYRFANIPYARQPVGDRRFKAAEPLPWTRLDPLPVNDGKDEVVCPQEVFGWWSFGQKFAEDLWSSKGPLDPKWSKKIEPADYPSLDHAVRVPNQNESCLVLDVFVPKRLFDSQRASGKVVVSFMSQGFMFGSRNFLGLPPGLLQQSGQFGEDSDIIYISVNYRLGAFGWLAGDQFVEQGGIENAGLTDQMRALEWVKRYAGLFGGDTDDVTVIGKSGGASSVMHLLTAYPGHHDVQRPPLNFNKAIIQSPAFLPITDRKAMDSTYQKFLDAAGARNLRDLRAASSQTLIEANTKTTWYTPFGLLGYGPVVSKEITSIMPAPPSLLFKNGYSQIDKLDHLMISSNRREGSLVTPPWVRTNAAMREYIHEIYPAMSQRDLDAMMSKYGIDESSPDEVAKYIQATKLFGDLGYDCNAWSLRRSTDRRRTYEYLYDLFVGYHYQDAGATFWNFTDSRLVASNNKIQSQRLQRYLTSFVKHGNPNTDKLVEDQHFPPILTTEEEEDDNDKQPSTYTYMYLGTGKPTKDAEGDTWQDVKTEDPLPPHDKCAFWEDAPYWDGNREDGWFMRQFPEKQREVLQVQNV